MAFQHLQYVPPLPLATLLCPPEPGCHSPDPPPANMFLNRPNSPFPQRAVRQAHPKTRRAMSPWDSTPALQTTDCSAQAHSAAWPILNARPQKPNFTAGFCIDALSRSRPEMLGGGDAMGRTDLPVGQVDKHGLIHNAPVDLAAFQDLTEFWEKVVLAESEMELPPHPHPRPFTALK